MFLMHCCNDIKNQKHMTYDGIGHLDLQPISVTTIFYTVKKHESNDCPDDIISIRNQFTEEPIYQSQKQY